MAEEKKGKVKITIEVEVNEALMGLVKDCMEGMPQMMEMFKKAKE